MDTIELRLNVLKVTTIAFIYIDNEVRVYAFLNINNNMLVGNNIIMLLS